MAKSLGENRACVEVYFSLPLWLKFEVVQFVDKNVNKRVDDYFFYEKFLLPLLHD